MVEIALVTRAPWARVHSDAIASSARPVSGERGDAAFRCRGQERRSAGVPERRRGRVDTRASQLHASCRLRAQPSRAGCGDRPGRELHEK